jgi:hypothetical protein
MFTRGKWRPVAERVRASRTFWLLGLLWNVAVLLLLADASGNSAFFFGTVTVGSVIMVSYALFLAYRDRRRAARASGDGPH